VNHLRVDIAVVGAGPAGLQAALAAAEARVRVALIDRYPRPGGQYFRQPRSEPALASAVARQPKAQALFQRVHRAENVVYWPETGVWAAFPSDGDEWLLALDGPDAPARLVARSLVLATGAYDRPIAFPGWTTPGVYTAGAVQTLLKSEGVLPGRRVLFTGSGPLQWAVAAAVADAGAEVILLEAVSRARLFSLSGLLALWRQGERLREARAYWRSLRRGAAEIRFGWAVVEVRGEAEVEEVIIARLDDQWRPIAGTEASWAADAVVIGYGFLPENRLAQLLGCAEDFAPHLGGYIPRRDETMQCSLPGVYVVGDAAGIRGADVAQLEGRIAGLAAAARVQARSAVSLQAALRPYQISLAQTRRFAHWLGRTFTPGPGLYRLARDDTTLCRCEEVRLADVRAAVANGAGSLDEVKAMTRAGMGYCQGRICGEILVHGMMRSNPPTSTYWREFQRLGRFRVRPPLFPLTLQSLAQG